MNSESNEVIETNKSKTSSAEQSSEGKDESEVKCLDIKDIKNSEEKTVLDPKVMNKSTPKEHLKYREIESRYRQSAQRWGHKRAEDGNSSGGLPSSRNPTPNPKNRAVKATKASTPVSTDKSLNCSGISVINRVNECLKTYDLKPDLKLKKYGKGLITGRQAIAVKRLPFGSDSDPNPVVGQTNRPIPLTVGLENQTKSKEIENSLIVSTHLQTLFLNLKAKQMRAERKANAFDKISRIWIQTNQLRSELSETQKSVNSLQKTIDSIAVLEKQKTCFEQYLSLRSEMDSLFNSLSELIAEQKLVVNIENCDQKDFHRLRDLIESQSKVERFESFEKLSNSAVNIEKSNNILVDIESIETEFKEYFQTFLKCVKELEKYERIDNLLNPQKSLSLKKLF